MRHLKREGRPGRPSAWQGLFTGWLRHAHRLKRFLLGALPAIALALAADFLLQTLAALLDRRFGR